MNRRFLEEILTRFKNDIENKDIDVCDYDVDRLAREINRAYRKQQNNTCVDSKRDISERLSFDDFTSETLGDYFYKEELIKAWLSYCSEFNPSLNNVTYVTLKQAFKAIDIVKIRNKK